MRIWAKRGRDIGTAQSKSGAPGLWSASFLIEPRQYPVGLLENRSIGKAQLALILTAYRSRDGSTTELKERGRNRINSKSSLRKKMEEH